MSQNIAKQQANTGRKRKRSQPFSHELIRDSIVVSIVSAVIFFLAVFEFPHIYAPADPALTPRVILPDWYLLWWYGFLKLWAFDVGPITAKVGGVLVPTIFIIYLVIMPFLEMNKKAARPAMEPRRTSIAAGIVTFIFTLTLVSLDVVIGDFYPALTKTLVIVTGYKYNINYLTIFSVVFPVLVSLVIYGWIVKTRKGFKRLKTKVIDTKNVCSFCSACIGVCPNNRILEEDFKIVESSTIPCMYCGHCSSSCFRYDYKPVSGIGDYSGMSAARSSRFGGQDGGMVTEFLTSAMDMGIIDACVVVDRDENWKPVLRIATTKDEIITASGSKYTHAKVISHLSEANKYSSKGIAIVGTPCQMEGLKQLTETVPALASLVKLKIGLFCTENFSYQSLYENFLAGKGMDISKIKKVDVRRGKLMVTVDSAEDLEMAVCEDRTLHEFSMKDLEPHVYEGCLICQDFSGIYSDVSIGGIGSEDGSNTILLRTAVAEEIYQNLLSGNSIEETEVDLKQVGKMCDLKIKMHPVNTK